MKVQNARLGRARRFGVSVAAAAACLAALAGSAVTAGASPSSPAASTGTRVSVESSPYGTILIAGSGPFKGFTLYAITSDHGKSYGCTPDLVIILNHVELSCTGEWPPLLTNGAPVAGKGVQASLLGSVFRKDFDNYQVTYAGHPLYLFDSRPGMISGERWDEPSLPPWHGMWYTVSPTGTVASGRATMDTQTISGNRTVMGTVMRTHLGLVSFTAYTFSGDSFNHSACAGLCAVYWPPVLSSSMPLVKSPLLRRDFGVITRHDGSQQVTFEGKPLYLFAYEGLKIGPTGPRSTGNGNFVTAFNGTFRVVKI